MFRILKIGYLNKRRGDSMCSLEKTLLTKIEKCRRLMVQASKRYSYCSTRVVMISSKLDDLLNCYDNLMREKRSRILNKDTASCS